MHADRNAGAQLGPIFVLALETAGPGWRPKGEDAAARETHPPSRTAVAKAVASGVPIARARPDSPAGYAYQRFAAELAAGVAARAA